jgi:ribonuclease PH
MTDQGEFVEIQGTAEREPFPRSDLDTLLGLAETGIGRLIELQNAVPAPR